MFHNYHQTVYHKNNHANIITLDSIPQKTFTVTTTRPESVHQKTIPLPTLQPYSMPQKLDVETTVPPDSKHQKTVPLPNLQPDNIPQKTFNVTTYHQSVQDGMHLRYQPHNRPVYHRKPSLNNPTTRQYTI